ncbi:MAG: short-chain dehydrogenase [Rhodovulum sulfidophilum]|uniref:Short-chain dehydrogenase n=1 Tax=Rhodovulum sulfidophilum TaxID=35806 RepID=A0A2W5N423_RHOSU|nr:MAG: short-chain dehydrogenase [Rhodovulum sulfidophilum]
MNHRGAVLITGAGRGLGRSIAFALAEAGYPVALGCRRREDAAAVAAEIAAAGGRALAVALDVADRETVEAGVAFAADWTGGRLSGLVNNAGLIEPIALLGDTDPSAWARLITVNLVGACDVVRAGLPRLTDGVIVNISSGAAATPMEGWSAYCASKAGLAMLTRCLALEYGARGIRCYGFRPGVVDTDMQAGIRASGLNPISRLRREELLPPEVPARAVAWLLSHRPEDLSGQEIDIRDPAFEARLVSP